MSRLGLDYTGHLSAKAHKSIGSSFACRYLSGGDAKDLDAGEAQGLLKDGIDVVLVWETTAERTLAAEAAGQADARAALAEAERLGLPAHRPIYFAVDFDEAPSQAADVAAYFVGVRAVLGIARVGVYGGFYTVERLGAAGLVRYVWQTYAWSDGQLSKRANIYQYSNGHSVAGVPVDYNRALKVDFGQWGYVPPPKTLHGKLHFQGVLDADNGKWEIEGTHGENVEFGEHARRWAAKISVGEAHGDWQVQSEPFEEVKK